MEYMGEGVFGRLEMTQVSTLRIQTTVPCAARESVSPPLEESAGDISQGVTLMRELRRCEPLF